MVALIMYIYLEFSHSVVVFGVNLFKNGNNMSSNGDKHSGVLHQQTQHLFFVIVVGDE